MSKSRVDIDDLPNPYLHRFLPADFLEVTDDMRAIFAARPLAYGADFDLLAGPERSLIWPMRLAHLKAAGLPEDYDQLGDGDRKAARMRVFTSYHDPAKPAVLITSVRNAVRAEYLWVEHYEKACASGRGWYTMRDVKIKYDMVSAALSEPLVPTEPAKTAISIPRGGSKTTTLIKELAKMLVITRPFTEVLICELNNPRTQEELGKIQYDFESNEKIHEDFGGEGTLFDTRAKGGKNWSKQQLDLQHLPGCSIMGYSFKAKQLGRHPKLILLDDIENPLKPPSLDERRETVRLIFKTFRFMLFVGCKMVFFGNARKGTVLETAVTEADGSTIGENVDARFNDFRKVRYSMILVDEKGARSSLMTDHTSVGGYDAAIEATGRSVVASELASHAEAEGDSVLSRDPLSHGYMHCIREYPGGLVEEYMLDLCTWEEQPWDEFIAELNIAAGCDIANSTQKDADMGAWVCAGMNPKFVIFLLDAYMHRQIAEKWAETAYSYSMLWKCARIGWEKAALQDVIIRSAQRIQEELQNDGHEEVPISIGLSNAARNKHIRVIATMAPLYRKRLIRFPRFAPIVDPTGTVHYPAPHQRSEFVAEIIRQLDDYTDEGPAGHDDGADALQMTIRTIGNRPGHRSLPEDQNKKVLERYRSLGIEWPAHLLPEGCVPAEPVIIPGMEPRGGNGFYEVDPYA